VEKADYNSITFDNETVKYIKKNQDSSEDVYREILLRDPIVQDFVNIGDKRRNELLAMIVQDPPRIDGTRWKLEDVQHDYMIEAWESRDVKTWNRVWSPEDFNEDYKTPSDKFDPVEAVHAALFTFFMENESSVRALLAPKVIPSVVESHDFSSEDNLPAWYVEAKHFPRYISPLDLQASKEWWTNPKFADLPRKDYSRPQREVMPGREYQQPARRKPSPNSLTSGPENSSTIFIVLQVTLALFLGLFDRLILQPFRTRKEITQIKRRHDCERERLECDMKMENK